MAAQAALTAIGAAALLAWLAVALDPARPWDQRPVAEDEPPPPDPATWPAVCVLVPARDEAAYLPRTLPALLEQDYPGPWRAVVVDDRSTDGTAEVARRLGDERLTVIEGGPLPGGWVGKVWALSQGAAPAGEPYLLLTDADIRHAPGSLRRLVAESEAAGLALNSRMARLRTISRAERLLIPPFLFFFTLLYPMRRVNRPGRVAAAAGGCILLSRDALARAGGFDAIRGEVIDDVRLARAIKRLGVPIRLSVSRGDVTSLREYGSTGSVWRMVRRTAFDELRYSWWRLAGVLAGMAVLDAGPPVCVAAAAVGAGPGGGARIAIAALGAAAWAVMAAIYLPSLRLLRVAPGWALTLPVAGVLYAGMTADSALRHVMGRRSAW